MKQKTSTVDSDEIEKFSKIASEWWNPQGKFGPLHRINPLRIQWILDQIAEMRKYRNAEENSVSTSASLSFAPLKSLRLLDIGCGGGLICEPMARLGVRVTGIDASEKNIAVAKLHAVQSGLDIDYRCVAAEDLAANGAQFDIILALEIIEHVADVEAFVAASCALLKHGGLIIYSTLNRTPKSFALAIVGAEYVLRWLPRGTHDWKKFLRPHELCSHLRHNNIEITHMTGMTMNPLNWKWRLDAKDLGVNYLVAGRKK